MSARADAKAAGLKRYFTGVSCPRGHVADRIVRSGGCVECDKAYNSRWKKEHREEHAAINREWAGRNRDEVRAANRRRAAIEPVELKRRRSKAFRARHPERVYANTARHRAARFKRVPLWADRERTAAVYARAAWNTELFETPYHVDHILPLQGDTISGLHVHDNLQILPGLDNVRKANKFIPYAEHYAPDFAVAFIAA